MFVALPLPVAGRTLRPGHQRAPQHDITSFFGPLNGHVADTVATLRRNVKDGTVGRVPVRLLAGARRRVLRLVAEHAGGTRREARFALRLR